MRFLTIFTALFYPYEQTAQNLDFVSSLVALCLSLFTLFLIERHRSQNQGSLKSKERFHRAMCPALTLAYLHVCYMYAKTS